MCVQIAAVVSSNQAGCTCTRGLIQTSFRVKPTINDVFISSLFDMLARSFDIHLGHFLPTLTDRLNPSALAEIASKRRAAFGPKRSIGRAKSSG